MLQYRAFVPGIYIGNIYRYYVAYLPVQGEYMQRRELKQTSPATREH
jgi:hypothetical protein